MAAYEDGLRDGRLDRLLGIRSDYAWYGYLDTSNEYMREYSRGYHDGARGGR